MTEPGPGTTFAGYEILGVCGRGGMGVVHRAREIGLQRLVALKLIAPALAQDVAFRDRFIRESRVAAGIDHPNVIPVYAAGTAEDGTLYLAMRFVEGDDLRTLVRREGPLAPDRAAGIVRQIAAALDAAHAGGVVHRDVKPANVLLDPTGHVYLTDFGLTRRAGSASDLTATGGWVGTLGYVAPEQIRGERVDARTDVYALGCVLHHALTGEAPFRRDSDEATLWAHLEEAAPTLDDVPGAEAFDAVLRRALAKDPDDRFPSAGDLGRAALAAARGEGALAGVRGRLVATGAAAPHDPDASTVADPSPGDRDDTATTGAVEDPDATRTSTPTRREPAGDPGEGRRPRRALPLVAAAGVLVLAGAGVGVLALGGDGQDEPGTPSTATTATSTTPAPPAVPRVGATLAAGSRPNAVAAGTGRRIYVLSNPDDRMTVIDGERSERTDRQPRVGRGAQSVDVGYDRVWVAKAGTGSLLRLSARTSRRAGAPIALPPGTPVRVRARGGSVWVGLRDGAGSAASAQTVAKFDPATGALESTITVPGGVQDLDVGDGAVWVVNRSRPSVVRIDVATGEQTTIPVGGDPRGVAVGGGSVWVADAEQDAVTQISTDAPYPRARIGVGRRPRGVAFGAGSVWVTNELDGTVTRIDPEKGAVVGEPVGGVGRNPGAISAGRAAVWVVATPDGTVARIDVPPTG